MDKPIIASGFEAVAVRNHKGYRRHRCTGLQHKQGYFHPDVEPGWKEYKAGSDNAHHAYSDT